MAQTHASDLLEWHTCDGAMRGEDGNTSAAPGKLYKPVKLYKPGTCPPISMNVCS